MKILQINSVCGVGSTGKILEDLHWAYKQAGYSSKVAWGRRFSGGIPREESIRIGTVSDYLWHGLESRILDNTGLGSRRATKKFLREIELYGPDVIHLHNLHGYYLNIEYLFNFLSEYNRPVIWTLHDCWAFTGHCAHFDYIGCQKWQTHCYECPLLSSYPKSLLFDRSLRNYSLKEKLFTSLNQLVLIPVSDWLARLLKQSFFKSCRVKVIHNGINTTIFKPTPSSLREKYRLGQKKVVLGVAFDWGERKGLGDFIRLAELLPETEYQIVLIGISDKLKQHLPSNILTIPKTDSQRELAQWYSEAEVFVNLTYEDNFPTVNLEAQECGTPVLTYETGGSVESVPIENVVNQGDLSTLVNKIKSQKLELKTGWDSSSMSRQYVELINNLI